MKFTYRFDLSPKIRFRQWHDQGRRQKFFQGVGGNGKKYRKLAKIPKNSTICLFQGGPTEKRPKNSKKG